MSKKTFYLIIFIFIVLGAVWGVWFFKQRATVADPNAGLTLRDFFPFGNTPSTETPASTDTETPGEAPTGDEPVVTPPVPILQKISSMPIAGAVVFEKERPVTETATAALATDPAPTTTTETNKTKSAPKPTTELAAAVRYTERERGHIYETYLDTIVEKKISNTTIPRIHEAFFGSKGETAILRYLESDNRTITTFAAGLPKEIPGGDSILDIKGGFLPSNISDLAIAPDTKKVFYLMPYTSSIIGTTSFFDGSQKTQLFGSEFTEWLSQWATARTILLTTKPSYAFAGYAYTLDTQTKSFDKLISAVPGLTTLMSPNGKLILYSESAGNSVSLKVFNVDTRESTDTGARTLPEKCTWGTNSEYAYCAVPTELPRANYPDKWYQGEVSFNDQIWKLDVRANFMTIVADPFAITGEEVDAIKLSMDQKESYLIFTNKKDSYLWALNLK